MSWESYPRWVESRYSVPQTLNWPVRGPEQKFGSYGVTDRFGRKSVCYASPLTRQIDRAFMAPYRQGCENVVTVYAETAGDANGKKRGDMLMQNASTYLSRGQSITSVA